MGAFSKRGRIGVMGEAHTRDELKAALMEEMEAEINGLAEWDQASAGVITLAVLEDRLVEVRQRLGEKMMTRLVEHQSGKLREEVPVSKVSGKRLHNKGKKQHGCDPTGTDQLQPDLLLR